MNYLEDERNKTQHPNSNNLFVISNSLSGIKIKDVLKCFCIITFFIYSKLRKFPFFFNYDKVNYYILKLLLCYKRTDQFSEACSYVKLLCVLYIILAISDIKINNSFFVKCIIFIQNLQMPKTAEEFNFESKYFIYIYLCIK